MGKNRRASNIAASLRDLGVGCRAHCPALKTSDDSVWCLGSRSEVTVLQAIADEELRELRAIAGLRGWHDQYVLALHKREKERSRAWRGRSLVLLAALIATFLELLIQVRANRIQEKTIKLLANEVSLAQTLPASLSHR